MHASNTRTILTTPWRSWPRLFFLVGMSTTCPRAELGWTGTEFPARAIFLNPSRWTSNWENKGGVGASPLDSVWVTADSGALHIHWQFDSTGASGRWGQAYLVLDTALSLERSDVFGIDVMGTPGQAPRSVELKFEGNQHAVFTLPELARIYRWTDNLTVLKPQFSNHASLNWSAVKVISVAITGGAYSPPDTGVLSIRKLRRGFSSLWDASVGFERISSSCLENAAGMNKAESMLLSRKTTAGSFITWKQDTSSWLYGQFAVLKALAARGEWRNREPYNNAAKAAQALARVLVEKQAPEGYWPRSWNALTGKIRLNLDYSAETDSIVWLGDFPWSLIGFSAYLAKSGDTTVLPALERARTFLFPLIEPDGLLYTVNPRRTGAKQLVTSTEAYAARLSGEQLPETCRHRTRRMA